MNRMIRTAALCVGLFALSLIGQVSLSDPLHKLGNEGTWIHVDSGWLFPKEVGGFARVGQPYNIDGNDDAGAEYRQAAGQLQAEVEIYAEDSAATGATLDGAKANAADNVDEAVHVESEKPFQVEALKDAGGVKVTYAAEGKSPGAQINLYFFRTDRWCVKVLASTQDRGKNGDRALDAFVRALPWKTLGTESGLH